jgi:hypothetical protein
VAVRLGATLGGAVVAAGVMILAFAPAAHADPMGTNCETNLLGALYCDGPVRPDGSWTRCVDVSPQPVYGGPEGQWDGSTMPFHQCYDYDPAQPPFKLGQPDHHIGDGL